MFFYRRNSIVWRKHTLWELNQKGAILKVKNEIVKKYSNLPARIDIIKKKKYKFSFSEELFINRYETEFKNIEAEELWISEFLKQTKWFFEKLNSCEEEYRNKYREKIFQIANLFIGEDKNSTHTFSRNMQWIYQTKIKNILVETNKNTYLQEIVETIISCFKESELEKFSKIDSQGKKWSFKEQLLDRYYSRYPSFASLEEIKKQIKKKLDKYKPLLLLEKNKSEATLELFMDELEKELFVSKATHDWNKEMFKNLSVFKYSKKIPVDIIWGIEQIISYISPKNFSKLSLKIQDKEYDLKKQLIARWSKAKLALGKKHFRNKLFELFIQNSFYFLNWENEEISRIDLQIFLELVDSCFLYPKNGRIIKIFLNKDDAGDILKLKKNIIYLINEFNRSRLFNNFLWIVLLLLFIYWIVISCILPLIDIFN